MSDVTETTETKTTVIDANSPEVQVLIDNAVKGLKDKNSELLGKLKEAADFKKQYDGVDPEKYRKIIPLFEQNEEAQLIADGKIEDVIKRRTERLEAEHVAKLKAASDEAQTWQQKAEAYKAQVEQLTIDDVITRAASDAGCEKGSEDIIKLMGRQVFKLEDDGVLGRDEKGNLLTGKSGALTPNEWVDKLKTTHPYLFGKAQGVGAKGSGNTSGAGLKRSTMTVAEKVNYTKEHGQEAFLALPN